jgi:hypothetical protein
LKNALVYYNAGVVVVNRVARFFLAQ